jgi:outer membrane protein assembly factor BamB
MRNLLCLLAIICCDVSSTHADEPAILGRWRFDDQAIRQGKLVPSIGDWQGKLVGQPSVDSNTTELRLDGVRDHVILHPQASRSNAPTDALSVELWVRVDQGGSWCGFISAIQDNGEFERGWMLGFRDTRFCFGLTSEVKKRLTYLSSPQTLPLSVWQHVVAVYDGRRMQLFVNGERVAESNSQRGDIIYAETGPVCLGAYVDDNEIHRLNGALADVTIYDGVLSPSRISTNYERDRVRFRSQVLTDSTKDWPTYMRDYARSGRSPDALELPLKLEWRYEHPHPPAPAWPPPAKQNFWNGKSNLNARVVYDRAFHLVSDGESVFFGCSSDDQVHALKLATGEHLWSYFTEGPVRLAPSIHNGRLLFGSDDGRVYCLDAASGEMDWRMRAVDDPLRIPGNGRIISLWPVRTGVLIDGQAARFAAGLFPQQGTFQFAVDTETGKTIASGKINFSPQGYLQRRGVSLIMSQGRAPSAMVSRLKRSGKSVPADTQRAPQEFPYAWIGAGDLRFAGGDGRVACFDATTGKRLWEANVEGAAYSLAAVRGRLIVSTDRGFLYSFRTATETAARPRIHAQVEAKQLMLTAADHRWAKSIAELHGSGPGYALLLGADLPAIAALVQNTDLRIVCREQDIDRVHRARKALNRSHLYGVRVSIHHGNWQSMPYASSLFNLIASREFDPQTSSNSSEIYRLLHPTRGVAVLGGAKRTGATAWTAWTSSQKWRQSRWQEHREYSAWTGRRQPIAGAGQWSHMYGNPANTACSDDQLASGEFTIQWFGRPGPRKMVDRHHRTTPPIVHSGRMYLPANERVIAVDTYNGTVLWEIPLAGFRRVGALRDAGNMVATASSVYALSGHYCYGLAADTGIQQVAFASPTQNGVRSDWGYLAVVKDQLIGSATRQGASRMGHSRSQIAETYYDDVPIVVSETLFALNRHSGERDWLYQPRGAIINPTITVGGNRVFLIESGDPTTLQSPTGRLRLEQLLGTGAFLVALDLRTGQEGWRRPIDLKKIRHHIYLAYAKGTLIAVGTRNAKSGAKQTVWYDLHGLDANSGALLWSATQDQHQGSGGSHGEQDHHPAIVGDVIYQEPYAYDLRTGKRKDNWLFQRGGHGCGSVSASANAFFFRAGTPTMCDLASGELKKVTSVTRPGCWINIIPADGLLLIPEASSGCTCDFAVQASMAFAPARDAQRTDP